jgi:hypothetical protein
MCIQSNRLKPNTSVNYKKCPIVVSAYTKTSGALIFTDVRHSAKRTLVYRIFSVCTAVTYVER